MLSHEERIAEVKRRTAEKERQKRLRRRWIAAASGVAACLAEISFPTVKIRTGRR